MTELIVKLFIKNKDKVEEPSVRTSYGLLASVVGIVCNVILFGVKLVAGMLINSIAVMADAFNNLSDAASSVISFIGVKIAGRPADKEHPFGHGRYEYIAALIVSFIILQVGLSLFRSSFDKIRNPETVSFDLLIVLILCFSVFLKVWLMLFNRKLGIRINSAVLKATATDSLGDVIVTSATVIAIVIGSLTRFNIDGYMGVIVSIVVMIAGFRIAKETLEPLIGQAIDREVYTKITDLVESYEGIVGSHDLIIHNYGPTNRMATIHVEVPNNIDFVKAHETIDQIERDLLTKMDIFLVIHMDPIEVNDIKVLEKKQMITDIIYNLEDKAAIHDFRVVSGEHQVNLIFDLVVPYSYTKADEQQLLLKIMEEVRKRDSKYQCVITLENSFIAEE